MNKQTMLAVSAREWEGLESRPHHLMRLCSRTGRRVVYLEPPASLLAPLKNGSMLSRWRNWRKGPRRTREGIILVAPPPVFPFGCKSRAINRVNQRLISGVLSNALRKLDVNEMDVYSFLPTCVDLLPYLHYNRLIYDCVDDHASFPGLISAEQVRTMEKELMKRAHVCFASAQALLRERSGWSSNFHLIPNGCEYEHFEPASRRGSLPTPTDLGEILAVGPGSCSKALIGFMGGLGDWIDYELLTELSRRLRGLTFVLVGPVTADTRSLARATNVHFLGEKPYRELPCYVQHFDVCLIPFRRNKLTESVNPIKLFEYLSAGKPVVSTPLPEVLPYKGVVDIEADADGFEEAVRRNLSEPVADAKKVESRRAVGSANSWNARWDRALELIQSVNAKTVS